MRDLDIVIVNYNTRDLLRACLRSVYASTGDLDLLVYVVDNASQDGSVEMVRQEYPQARVIANAANVGYAAANNIALREMDARHALLLNSDTLLPPEALRQALDFMTAHPDTGIMGPKLVRPDGSLDLACRRSFPTPGVAFARLFGLSKLFPNDPRFTRYNLSTVDPDLLLEVDAVVGAFMLIRREVIEQICLLDETFFAFGEDLDFCYRAKVHRGWKVFYNPAITVLHYKGESMKQRSYAMTIQFYRAMWLFHRKHFARQTFFLFNGLIALGIAALCGIALLKNLLRPAGRKKAGM